MTAAAPASRAKDPSASPSLAVVMGRVLMASGGIFGLSNLFQYTVQSGLLPLHPAVLGLSWPIAVATFITLLIRIRKSGGEAGPRAARFSRLGIMTMIGMALTLLVLGFVLHDFTTMLWMSPLGLCLYAVGWTVAAVRSRTGWMIVPALGALVGAGVVVSLLGTPNQYLAYACGLLAFAFVPGAWLALGGKS
jgi:hypothetical protein